VDFFNVLTGPELLEQTETHLPEHRGRLYPPYSDAGDVHGAGAERRPLVPEGGEWLGCAPSVRGSEGQCCGYRRVLPGTAEIASEDGQGGTRESGRLLSAKQLPGWRWRGRTVKLVDGSMILMPDTRRIRASYPPPSSQALGVGFPLARTLAVICLSTGAVLEVATAPYEGTGTASRVCCVPWERCPMPGT